MIITLQRLMNVQAAHVGTLVRVWTISISTHVHVWMDSQATSVRQVSAILCVHERYKSNTIWIGELINNYEITNISILGYIIIPIISFSSSHFHESNLCNIALIKKYSTWLMPFWITCHLEPFWCPRCCGIGNISKHSF